MSPAHPASVEIEKLLADCQVSKTRRGGPGGQHRNKVESAVVITHLPTGVMGEAGERRSQHENRDVAIQRLRVNLALAVRTPGLEIDSAPQPDEGGQQRVSIQYSQLVSPLWKQRLESQGRLQVSSRHSDFPALLAEALDTLQHTNWSLKTAAAALLTTSSQLLKLLKLDYRGIELVNRQRANSGLKPLK